MVWYDMISHMMSHMVSHMISSMISYDMLSYEMLWNDMMWYDVKWNDMILYSITVNEMLWYEMKRHYMIQWYINKGHTLQYIYIYLPIILYICITPIYIDIHISSNNIYPCTVHAQVSLAGLVMVCGLEGQSAVETLVFPIENLDFLQIFPWHPGNQTNIESIATYGLNPQIHTNSKHKQLGAPGIQARLWPHLEGAGWR